LRGHPRGRPSTWCDSETRRSPGAASGCSTLWSVPLGWKLDPLGVIDGFLWWAPRIEPARAGSLGPSTPRSPGRGNRPDRAPPSAPRAMGVHAGHDRPRAVIAITSASKTAKLDAWPVASSTRKEILAHHVDRRLPTARLQRSSSVKAIKRRRPSLPQVRQLPPALHRFAYASGGRLHRPRDCKSVPGWLRPAPLGQRRSPKRANPALS
jgi:hypothetical protein